MAINNALPTHSPCGDGISK